MPNPNIIQFKDINTDASIYPVTLQEGVIDSSGQNLFSYIAEYNISLHKKNSDHYSSNYDTSLYTLQEAINQVPTEYRNSGLKLTFNSSATKVETYMCTNPTWTTNVSKWDRFNNVTVSQNASTGHTEINIGGVANPVASVEEVNQLDQRLSGDIEELQDSVALIEESSIIDYIPSGTKSLSSGTYYAAIQSKQMPDRSAAGVLKYIKLLLAPEQNTSFFIRLYKKVWSDDIITGFTAVDGGTYSFTFPSGQTTMDVSSENITIDEDVIIAISGLAKYADNETNGAFAVANGAYVPAFDGKFSMNIDYVIEIPQKINEVIQTINNDIQELKESGPVVKKDVSIIDYIPAGSSSLSQGTYYAAIQSKQLPDRSAAGVLKYIKLLSAPAQNTSFSIRLYKKVWSDDVITGFTAVDTYSLTFPSGQTTMDVLSENIVIDKDVIIAISGLAKYADNITNGAFAVANGVYASAFDGKFSMNIDYVIEMQAGINDILDELNETIDEVKTLYNCNIAILGDSITWLGGDNCDGVQGDHIGQGWTQYFKELAKPQHIQSFARSGATWSHTSATKYNITENTGSVSADNVIYNQINRLLASNQIPDIIIIAAGINDILFRSSSLNVNADTAFANTDGYILDTPVGELTSIAEALRYDIELLKTNYPNAQIFVTTPLQCTTTSLTNCFSGGEIIKGCCKYLSLHCFDQAAEAGIYRAEEREEYFHTYDGLHTSVAGAKMVGQYLYRCVLSTARNLI